MFRQNARTGLELTTRCYHWSSLDVAHVEKTYFPPVSAARFSQHRMILSSPDSLLSQGCVTLVRPTEKERPNETGSEGHSVRFSLSSVFCVQYLPDKASSRFGYVNQPTQASTRVATLEISPLLRNCGCASEASCFLLFSLDGAVSDATTWLFLTPPKDAVGMRKPNLQVCRTLVLWCNGKDFCIVAQTCSRTCLCASKVQCVLKTKSCQITQFPLRFTQMEAL